MEEQKNKEVKMGVVKGEQQKEKIVQQYSKEQLLEICDKQQEYINSLSRQLHQANTQLAYRRLDYLLAILKYENVIKDPDFIGSCVDEIKNAFSFSKEEDEENDQEEN